MPPVDQKTAARKKIAEPILTHLFDKTPNMQEAIMVLLLCLTELTARALESQDPVLIGERMREMLDAWIDSMTEPQNRPPKTPPVKH